MKCFFQAGSRCASSTALVSLLAVLGQGRPSTAQTILHQWSGTIQPGPVGNSFGWSLAGVGDVNMDGVPDVAVGADSAHSGSLLYAGRLYVFSGLDGSTLFTLDGTTAYEGLAGRIESAGDMDRDGHVDILVSSSALPGGGGFHLVSGRTGTILGSYADRVSAAGVGDVDSDGWPDLMFGGFTTLPMNVPGPGFAEVVSGRTGAVIYSYSGTYPRQLFGWMVEGAGDVNGDGVPDLLIGASGNYPWTASDGIWVYSGATGGLLFRRPPQGSTDSFPWVIAGVGDVNGDGLDDVAASDLGIRVSNNYSEVVVLGNPNGAAVLTLPGAVNHIIGFGVAGPGDIDGDGFHEVLTQGLADPGPHGLVQLHSGQNQSLFMSMIAAGPCAGVGDVNGDDFPDYVIGGMGAPPTLNVVRVYSGAPPGVSTLGQGCADSRGVVPRIGCTYVPARGSQFAVNLSRVRSGVPAVLALGLSTTAWNSFTLPLDLSAFGMLGCFLRVSPDVARWTRTTGPAEKGRASLPMPIPNDPTLIGLNVHAQWLVLEQPGTNPLASTTRALTLTIQ